MFTVKQSYGSVIIIIFVSSKMGRKLFGQRLGDVTHGVCVIIISAKCLCSPKTTIRRLTNAKKATGWKWKSAVFHDCGINARTHTHTAREKNPTHTSNHVFLFSFFFKQNTDHCSALIFLIVVGNFLFFFFVHLHVGI